MPETLRECCCCHREAEGLEGFDVARRNSPGRSAARHDLRGSGTIIVVTFPADPPSTDYGPLLVTPVSFADPRVADLVEQVQSEYTRLYGSGDRSPIDAGQFEGARGGFLLGSIGQEPVAMVGWRRLDAVPALPGRHCAEVKRMFVTESLRGQGLSKAMLAAVEDDARAHGVEWLVLETGDLQPRAIALYRSHGYHDLDGFGWAEYYGEDGGVSLGKELHAGLDQ